MFFGRSDEIPSFIPHSKISSAVQDLIEGAQRELVLVTPYFKPWNHLQNAIRGRLEARIPVALIVREDEVSKTAPHLQPFAAAGAQVLCLDRLHAKLYLSEQCALLTSMNLVETSALNSWECALQIKASESPTLFKQFEEQVRAIRKSAKPLSSAGLAAAQPVVAAPAPKPEVNLIQLFGIRKTDLKPEMVEARRTHPRAYEPWSDEEIGAVAELARRKLGVEDIARLLGRQPSAIERKLKELF
ncbi:phospholipase D-like domain-containing protein [Myxococcus guangdongensis]|uniref:phospholipase D-like domain-containing protein n=1 Tax=Myxococcus guangdongensis TaxID=2906760 RepID=UPI0020A80B2E|nr:phospholipase D-like domain-containing protein [Myxococcus guangdongensis]